MENKVNKLYTDYNIISVEKRLTKNNQVYLHVIYQNTENTALFVHVNYFTIAEKQDENLKKKGKK